MHNYIKEIKALLILTFLFLFVFFLPKIISIIYSQIGLKLSLIIFSSYITIIFISKKINKVKKNNLTSKIEKIITYPFDLAFAILTFIIPISIILIHLIFYVGISFLIPELIYLTCDFIDNQLISQQTHIYLLISSASFIMVILNFQLRSYIHRISPARFKTSEKLKPYRLEEISEYILSENNVRFIIYSTYVIILTIINFSSFQAYTTIFNPYENTILQSFVTFIAFDRAIGIMKNLNFKPSDFLIMLIRSVYNKLESIKSNNNVIHKEEILNEKLKKNTTNP